LLDTIEQVVRLIRSKGVGVYFVTQNPRDIPDRVLGQLGNRILHALRAFTPLEQKAVKAAAETFRVNPEINTERALTELAVGEALISLLDEQGQPGIVERAWIRPPHSQIGPIRPDQRQQMIRNSVLFGAYEKVVDRESAYERLKGIGPSSGPTPPPSASAPPKGSEPPGFFESLLGGGATSSLPSTAGRGRGRTPEGLGTAMAKSVVRSVGSSIGREIVRGLLGSILGGRRR
jgi:uncharacterized protein